MRSLLPLLIVSGLVASGCGQSAEDAAKQGKIPEPVVKVPSGDHAGVPSARPAGQPPASVAKPSIEAPARPAAEKPGATKAEGPEPASRPEPKPSKPEPKPAEPAPEPAAQPGASAAGAGEIVKAGMAAPQVSFLSGDGRATPLAELVKESKVTVLAFVDSSGVSLRALKSLLDKPVAQAYKDRGVRVVAVERGAGAAEAKSFAEKAGVSFPVLADPKGEAFGKFAAQIVPRIYVIDSSGTVRHVSVGAPTDAELEALMAAIDAVLK